MYSLTDFAPGNQLNVVLLKQLAESLTGNKLEIALPPFRTPIGMFKCQPSHFFIVICEMHDHFRDTRLNLSYCVGVELRPALGGDSGFDANDAVHHHIIRAQQRREKGCRGKPFFRDSNQVTCCPLILGRRSQTTLEFGKAYPCENRGE